MGRPPKSGVEYIAAARRIVDRMQPQLGNLRILIDRIESRLRIDAREVTRAYDALLARGTTHRDAMNQLAAGFERSPKHIERLIRDGRKALKKLEAPQS